MKVKKAYGKSPFVNLFKILLKIGMTALQFIAGVGLDDRKLRYGVLRAEELYEDGIISDTEYARVINGRKK